MANKVNTLDVLRDGSAIAKAYNLLKDGKVHKLSTVRATLNKAGINRPMGMLFRLCRILRRNAGQQLSMSKRTDTVQMIKFGAKPAAVKSHTTKPVAKKANKTKAIKAVTKAIAVPAGHEEE